MLYGQAPSQGDCGRRGLREVHILHYDQMNVSGQGKSTGNGRTQSMMALQRSKRREERAAAVEELQRGAVG